MLLPVITAQHGGDCKSNKIKKKHIHMFIIWPKARLQMDAGVAPCLLRV